MKSLKSKQYCNFLFGWFMKKRIKVGVKQILWYHPKETVNEMKFLFVNVKIFSLLC